MDKMTIKSKIITGFISKILTKSIRKASGIEDMQIFFEDIEGSFDASNGFEIKGNIKINVPTTGLNKITEKILRGP